MPPDGPTQTPKPLQEVVDAVGLYPADAFSFVIQGLNRTVRSIHGPSATDAAEADPADAPPAKPRRRPPAKVADEGDDEQVSRHISGRDLCLGLRDEAWDRWGMLARTVLARWNVTSTMDFGRIVFALVEHQHLQKTADDRLNDFRGVFDFRTALEADYRITAKVDAPAEARPKRAGKKQA